jgi:Tol biopolymer transport system component
MRELHVRHSRPTSFALAIALGLATGCPGPYSGGTTTPAASGPSCSGGAVPSGDQCVCPDGTAWDGAQCAAQPPPTPTTPTAAGPATEVARVTALPGDETSPTVTQNGTQLVFTYSGDGTGRQGGIFYGHFDSPLQGEIPDARFGTLANKDQPNNSLALADGTVYWTSANASTLMKGGLGTVPVAVLVERSANPGQAVPVITSLSATGDGQWLAFVEWIPTGNSMTVVVIRGDGTDRRNIGDWVGVSAAFSPDGTKLALSRIESDQFRIYIHDMASGAETLVPTTNGGMPAWSPDGRFLAYRANASSSSCEMHAYDTQTGADQQIAWGTPECRHLSWASDGYLYFASNSAGSFDIWRLRPGVE